METARLGQVIYRVREMEPCVAFYRDVIGLKLKFRDGDRWTAFNADGVTFALSAAEGQDIGTGATGVAAFRVSDIEVFALGVTKRGGPTGTITKGPHESRFELTDPSGNKLVFYQPFAPPSAAAG